MNEFDKLKILLPPNHYYSKYKRASTLGIELITKSDGALLLKISGKALSNPTNLGGMTRENIKQLLNIFSTQLTLNISEYDLINNSVVLSIDVKKDIYVNKPTNLYISSIKELFNKSSKNNEIIIFQKNLGHPESILVKPATITGKDSFCIYSKYRELEVNKFKEPEYFDNFAPEFLKKCKNILRFERRLQSFSAIRKAFHIKEKGNIPLKVLLDSDSNVIYERFIELIGEPNNETK